LNTFNLEAYRLFEIAVCGLASLLQDDFLRAFVTRTVKLEAVLALLQPDQPASTSTVSATARPAIASKSSLSSSSSPSTTAPTTSSGVSPAAAKQVIAQLERALIMNRYLRLVTQMVK